ncbi:MAG: pseudouridine synthase, RluA family protein [Paenibacillus sp.]|nr:pseudouridine synthase, RluA family protein [Paenibacillus sp.]
MRRQSSNNQRNHPQSSGSSNPRNSAHHNKPASGPNKPPAPPKRFTVNEPSELLTFLLSNITNQGRNAVKSLLAHGLVRVDDKVIKVYNYNLIPGQNVTVMKAQASAAEEAQKLVGLTILHEDSDIIVVQKDAGLLSIATAEEKEITAYRQLTSHVRRNSDANSRIYIVHRLDRDTSGVMLFAKSEKVQQVLQDSWQELVKERTYIALVEGAVKKTEGTISSWLKESKTLKMYSSPYPNDGQHAVTHYKVIQTNRDFSMLEVHLETGRKNQIRVHMEDIGHPIVGDKKYGSKSKAIGRLGLHARVIAFLHPATGKLLRFESAIPKVFNRPFKEL